MFDDSYRVNPLSLPSGETTQFSNIVSHVKRRYRKRLLSQAKLHNRINFTHRQVTDREMLLGSWCKDALVSRNQLTQVGKPKFSRN
jgi:hypothetical protein